MNWLYKRHKIIYKYFRSQHLLKRERITYNVICIYNRLYGRMLTSIVNCKGIYFLYSNVYVDKLLSAFLYYEENIYPFTALEIIVMRRI